MVTRSSKPAAKSVRPRQTPEKRGGTAAQAPLPQFDLLQDSLGYAIKRAQVRIYDMVFAALGADSISPARVTALSIIATRPGINQSALAESLGINRASVVKVIDTLGAHGFVERRAIPGDRRSYALVVTDAGKSALQDIGERLERSEAAIAAKLTKAERAQLMALLAKVAVS